MTQNEFISKLKGLLITYDLSKPFKYSDDDYDYWYNFYLQPNYGFEGPNQIREKLYENRYNVRKLVINEYNTTDEFWYEQFYCMFLEAIKQDQIKYMTREEFSRKIVTIRSTYDLSKDFQFVTDEIKVINPNRLRYIIQQYIIPDYQRFHHTITVNWYYILRYQMNLPFSDELLYETTYKLFYKTLLLNDTLKITITYNELLELIQRLYCIYDITIPFKIEDDYRKLILSYTNNYNDTLENIISEYNIDNIQMIYSKVYYKLIELFEQYGTKRDKPLDKIIYKRKPLRKIKI